MFKDNSIRVELPEGAIAALTKDNASPSWGIDLADPSHSLIACNCHDNLDKSRTIAQADIDMPTRQYPMDSDGPATFTLEPGKENILVFDMDLSASMKEFAGTGLGDETKLAVAESSLNKTLATVLAEKERLEKESNVPLDVKFEVRVFGFPASADPCRQSMVRLPLQPLTKEALTELAADETVWRPTGNTPTTFSLQQINDVDLLSVAKDANVVADVITDGAETKECGNLCDYYRDVWNKQHPKWPLQLIFQNMTDAAAIRMSTCMERHGAPKHQEAYDEDSLVNGMLHSVKMDLHGEVLPVQKKPNDQPGN